MISFWIDLWDVQFFNDSLLWRDEISNACKNWEKMLGKDIEWTKVFACIKKIKKLKEDDFKQRFVIEFLWQTQFWRIWEWSRTISNVLYWSPLPAGQIMFQDGGVVPMTETNAQSNRNPIKYSCLKWHQSGSERLLVQVKRWNAGTQWNTLLSTTTGFHTAL